MALSVPLSRTEHFGSGCLSWVVRPLAHVMRYIAVHWHQSSPDYPIELYSEIDDAGWEQRKVEVFADGRRSFADKQAQNGSTELGLAPVPPLAEIAADPQFKPREISRDEFEDLWKSARH